MCADSTLAVIPARNCAANIALVVALTYTYLPVLVVDDDSTDDTMFQAEAAGATVLLQMPRQGREAALRKGFHWAFKRDYAAVLTLPADRPCDPHVIPLFLERFAQQGADLIIGMRDLAALPWQARSRGRLRQWGLSWAVGQPVYDIDGGYWLISHRLLAQILPISAQAISTELLLLVTCIQQGWRLDWVTLPPMTTDNGRYPHIRSEPRLGESLRTAWRIWRNRLV